MSDFKVLEEITKSKNILGKKLKKSKNGRNLLVNKHIFFNLTQIKGCGEFSNKLAPHIRWLKKPINLFMHISGCRETVLTS